MASHDVSVYPPYLTDQAMRCMQLYDLAKRWRKREPAWTPYILIGNAVAAGLEAFFKNEGEPYEIAEAIVRDGFEEGGEWGFDGLVKHARTGVMVGSSTDLGCAQTLGVERQYARCKPDFVGRKPNGGIRVVDHKVKMSIDNKYVGPELKRFETANQFFEYAWAVGEFYAEPIEDICVHLIIIGPRPRAILHPITITEARLGWWLRGAEKAWQDMHNVDEGSEKPWPRISNCMDRWGPCPMYELCHDMGGDEKKAKALYDRVRRGDK